MSSCHFCVVEHHGLKITFHHHVKENLFNFSTKFLHFFRYISWPETDIVASDSVSHFVYRIFRWYFLTFFCYCTAGWTKLFLSLRRFKSMPTCSSIFRPLTGSAEMSPLDYTARDRVYGGTCPPQLLDRGDIISFVHPNILW